MVRYLTLGILFLLMTVLGWFLVPFLYPFRKFIRKHKENFFWYFLNDTIKGRDSGDFGRFSHNFVGYYRQCAIRNPHWNLKLKVSPKVGVKTDITGDLEWRRYDLKGFINNSYKINGTKYFRFSYSAGWWYCQFGASDNRYIYKVKINLTAIC